jgi:hypothetical protein
MKKKIRYVCIDDNPDEVELALKRLKRSDIRLETDISPPFPFAAQIEEIQRRRQQSKLDGLLLDLRLDQNTTKAGKAVDYNAQLVASQLRSMMAERKLEEFPIILWSITSKLARSFDRDLASHDLFDLVLDKERLDDYDPPAATQLVSFAYAYASIATYARNSDFWTNVLRPPKTIELDSRIGEEFKPSLKKTLVHVLSRYVFEEIIKKPGPLIDEDTLYSRMGLDSASVRKSKLPAKLTSLAGYSGPFSDTWCRWWWVAIEEWWKSVDPDITPILSLTAAGRVAALKDNFGYSGLRPAEPIAQGNSSRFTTICQGLKKPLDPIDGFMLSAIGLKPWHDRLYVCEDVARRPSKHNLERPLDSLEADRVKALPKTQPPKRT